MKTFRYTCRDSAGALKSGSLQAADRADALRQIKAAGDMPVSVSEENTPLTDLVPHLPFSTKTLGACMGVISFAALLYFLLPLLSQTKSARSTASAEKHQAKATQNAALQIRKQADVKAEEIEPAAAAKVAVITPVTTNVASGMPPDPPKTVRASDFKKYVVPTNRPVGARIFSKDGVDITPRGPKFNTQTDRFLWGLLNNPGGHATTVLSPALIERDFANALENKIPIDPDDDEATIAMKKQIEQVKAEIADLVKNGDNLHEIIRDIQRDYNDAASYRRQTRQTLFNLIKQGELEAAANFQAESNEELQERGLDPISVPNKLLDQALEQK